MVQNTASSLGLYCFTKLNEALKVIGGKSISTVYDSIELEVPIDKAAEALEMAFYYMDDFPVKEFDWLDLPIGVEAEIGYNWGDAKVIHRGSSQSDILKFLEKM